MLEVAVYNTSGEQIETLEVDEAIFGSTVNVSLVKQAVVAYHANRRQGTAATRSRGMVVGSTRKMYRQKGTGNARRGNCRTGILRGGGVTFAKIPHSFRKGLPRKMRKAALKSAILAKLLGNDLLVVDGLSMDSPRTAEMAKLLANLDIRRSCLLTLAEADKNVYLSSRNIPHLTVQVSCDLNAYDVAIRQKMLVTSQAMRALLGGSQEADE